jgi:hypothetical protein
MAVWKEPRLTHKIGYEIDDLLVIKNSKILNQPSASTDSFYFLLKTIFSFLN